jgi:hypothetical protein
MAAVDWSEPQVVRRGRSQIMPVHPTSGNNYPACFIFLSVPFFRISSGLEQFLDSSVHWHWPDQSSTEPLYPRLAGFD